MVGPGKSYLEPPGIHWPLIASHVEAPKPIGANRRPAVIRERLLCAVVLLALAAAGAALGMLLPP